MLSGSFWWIIMIPEFIFGYWFFYQDLGEYARGLLQWSINHLSCHIIHLVQPHCFSCPILVYQEGEYFHDYGPYGEYGHRGHQIGLSLILDEWYNFLLEESLCFCMCIYFYWSPLDFIHVCDYPEVVVLWVSFHVCKMGFWRRNILVLHHVT